jgi:DtxR family Mn-dependent transcriptional regulator
VGWETAVSDLIDTTEMYLRTVFELQEENVPPLRARIAERLGQSGPTVSQTVARMERDGLLHVGPDRQILLTETGQALAARVMRKHRLAECLLVNLLQVPWDEVHAEACRWEHVISESVENRIFQVLDGPTESPFGNPIPALGELDPTAKSASTSNTVFISLLAAARETVTHVRVIRIDETAQAAEGTLRAFRRAGLRPGETVKCRSSGDRILVGSAGEYTEVSSTLAVHILVAPTRSLDGEDLNAG